ncbi:MAG: hypothetical protein LBG59_08180 [Candidatus Peribacteria bacterium]|jgi:hypothetical protein|nr:hypothetical protein [Candidatus Peribacteria bacterium]
MAPLLDHFSKQDQEKILKFRESLPPVRQNLFTILLRDNKDITNPEEIIKQFFDATIFKEGKGMLAILQKEGTIERSSVEEHQISLKDFVNSF